MTIAMIRLLLVLSIFAGNSAAAWQGGGLTTRTPTVTNGAAVAQPATATSTQLYVTTGDDKQATTATASTSSFSRINPLVSKVRPSQTVEIFSRVKQMQAEGIDVTSLCVGEPDFPPPQTVLDAVTEAVVRGETTYTAVTGTLALRQAIAQDLQRRKGLTYNPQTEIVVGNGAKQCVFQGVLATVGAGDAVLIPAPYWPSYPEMATLNLATPVIVQTDASNGYLLTPAQLRQCLEQHDNIKLMILCNPSNPTGGVYSKAQLEGLAAVLEDFPQVSVLADEIYERLVYTTVDNGEVTSFATCPNMFERTMTVNGFSKAYAMTGLRLGYLCAPQPLARAVTTIQSQLTSCAGSVSQAAGVAALTRVPDQVLLDNVEIMRSKRDYVLQELASMPNVLVQVAPAGAFYVLPDVSAYYNGDDVQLCKDLLEQERLALVPGTSFGAPGTVRISYATSMQELEVAMQKLRRFLDNAAAASK